MFAKEPLIARLPALQVPTLFMYGTHDWMDWKAAETARAGMTVPTRMVRVPEAGHQLFLDNPAQFNVDLIEGVAWLQAEASKGTK